MTATLRHRATPVAMLGLHGVLFHASWDDDRKGEFHGQPIALE